MIILDEEDQRRTKQDPFVTGPTLRFPEKVAGRSDSPLPDYETSEARHQLILRKSEPPRRLDARLWRAILYAFAIYVILSIAIGVPIIVLKKAKDSEQFTPDPSIWGDEDPDPGPPLNLADANGWTLGVATHCNWSTTQDDGYTYTARSLHSLLSSGSFFLRSNLSLISDKSSVIQATLMADVNPDSSATNITFDVNLRASSRALLRSTGVCFNDTGVDRGLFVYTSRKLTNADALWLEIRLLFPQNSSHHLIDTFGTYLPWFSQTFGNLTEDTSFNNVIIEGTGRDIVFNSVKAPKISVKNSYASIRGAFRASDTLTLDSIKGSIITNITLASDPNRQTPTYLTLDTGDGDIDARVSLLAPSSWFLNKPAHPRAFVADVKTFNAPLKLKVSNSLSTPPVPLQLTAQNNLANTSVTLDSNYEGTFSVQTKLSHVTIRDLYVGPSFDPLHENRQRNLSYSQNSSTRARGWIGWGQKPSYGDGVIQGQVKIISSLSPIMLQFSGS